MDDNQTDQTDGGALRKQLEKALADLKKVQEDNTKLSTQVRTTSVKELFGELKADPRGAKFYAGESTKEALAEWLKSDGDVFATAPAVDVDRNPQNPLGPIPGTATPQFQLPPGITPEMLTAAQATAGMAPTPPVQPTGDLGALTDQLSGLTFNDPGDAAKLTSTWQAIRTQAAAALANGNH